jgi:transcriptional regulator with XRE-family HTH domain
MIGYKIKTLREAKRLSQEELAFRLGMPQSTLCKIENNQLKIDSDKIEKLAQELGVHIEELFDNKGVLYAPNAELHDNSQMAFTIINDYKEIINK